jgi:NADP-dependent 3-hydroxy acid dehydrogenase YdfG
MLWLFAISLNSPVVMNTPVVLVTGASSGIGRATVSACAALGWSVAATIRRQFETNVFDLMRVTRAVVPVMRRQGNGTLVQISSMGGRVTFPLDSIYHATKWAVERFSESLGGSEPKCHWPTSLPTYLLFLSDRTI